MIMKKYFNFALLSAIALTGTIGFTACSSDEPLAEKSPTTVDNESGDIDASQSVNTQFVLNIATKANNRRSAAADVQESGNFRGMEKVKMFAFNTGTKKAVQKNATFGAVYDLDKLLAAGTVTADNSNRIVNINIPIGTDAFLFYGKAIKGEGKDDLEGKIDYSVNVTDESKLETKFTLQPRVSTTNLSILNSTESFVADILNNVFSGSVIYTKDGETETSTMTFASLGAQYATEKGLPVHQKTLTPLELSLGEAFYKLSTIGTNELRGGSADAILSSMAELKKTLKAVTAATPTGTQETAAKALAETTNTLFATFFNWNATTEVVTFNEVSVLKATAALSGTWGTNTTITDAILGGFPQYFGLPAGCSLLSYDTSSKKFKYKTSAGSNLLDQALYNRDKMMFPAELTYYCNGAIRTSNNDKQIGGYPNGTSNWTKDAQWTAKGWSSDAAAITSNTRAAALIPNVNYGVAMLKSQVKLDDVTKFYDNKEENTGETSEGIDKANIKLQYTGIIIGGQCPQVGWDFLRRQTTDNFDYIIYDNRINGQPKGTGVGIPTDDGVSASNYTLLFDNYKCGATVADAGAQEDQDDVFVALEFVNNGDDFWGQGNKIKKGSTFYLTAKLPKPTAAQASSFVWPGTTDGDVNRYYQVPPIDESGDSRKIARVFVQDYRTTATFTIGKETLKKALVTVPDLRSTQMSFGLSVDLTWKAGMTYEDIELGTE